MTAAFYPIGTPGVAWSAAEIAQWRASRTVERSYQKEVVEALVGSATAPAAASPSPAPLSSSLFQVEQYGSLSHNPERYPLYVVSSKNWAPEKPNVLITGGVHGYETSGVQGALLFLKEHAADYLDRINLVVFPCVSPWGYERIQRWNYDAVDPNRRFSSGEFVPGRSFNPEAATEESTALRAYLRQKAGDEGNGSTTTTTSSKPHWLCHLDLHETTDTDETEFQPAKAARDGKPAPKKEGIPDGFYLVTEGRNQQDHQQLQQPLDASDWYAAMIAAVEKVTHIAPPDERNTIIGEPVVQKGVIALPAPANVLGLCAGVTDAPYTATTEVYPDSPSATAEICNQAQVACIRGALDFLLNQRQEKRSRLEMNGSGYIKLYGTTMSRLNTLFGCAAT